jgi:hypothetical protein
MREKRAAVALTMARCRVWLNCHRLGAYRVGPTRCALSVGDIVRRHDGKSYIVDKVWFNEKTGHWIADESPLEEL